MFVWVPASVYRVSAILHPGFNYPLTVMGAIVLPAQGLVNWCVYAYVTQKELLRLATDLVESVKGKLIQIKEMWRPKEIPSNEPPL